jgi:hypothetical protein
MPTFSTFCRPISFLASSGVVLGLALLAGCGKQEPASTTAPAPASPTATPASATTAPATTAPATTAPATTAPATTAPATVPAAGVAKVKGRWLRPDGGYILAITTIAADGRAEAGYFNPNPIKVAWATVNAEGADIRVKVELRDENYPGCVYKLNYAPDKDRLVGTYFQAQMQQTYEVEFVREP